MPKQPALSLRAPSRRSHALQSIERRASQEWQAFGPAAILMAILAGIVLVDGLLTIGLFELLGAIGLREPPIDPSTLSVGAGLDVGRRQTEPPGVSFT